MSSIRVKEAVQKKFNRDLVTFYIYRNDYIPGDLLELINSLKLDFNLAKVSKVEQSVNPDDVYGLCGSIFITCYSEHSEVLNEYFGSKQQAIKFLNDFLLSKGILHNVEDYVPPSIPSWRYIIPYIQRAFRGLGIGLYKSGIFLATLAWYILTFPFRAFIQVGALVVGTIGIPFIVIYGICKGFYKIYKSQAIDWPGFFRSWKYPFTKPVKYIGKWFKMGWDISVDIWSWGC